MALSIAQRSQLRKRAAVEAAANAGPSMTMEGATAYELQMAQLHQHRQLLKNIQSQEGKADAKRQLLGDYAPYVAGVLEAGRGAQDEVLTTVMVWRIDVGDYAGALDIAGYVLKHGLTMPDRFERSTGCLIAEEVANAALKALKGGGDFDLALLVRTQSLTDDQDMPDEARAKLHLAMAKAELKQVNPEQLDAAAAEKLKSVEAMLGRAIELHDKCGAKKDLEQVQRLLKKHAGTTG